MAHVRCPDGHAVPDSGVRLAAGMVTITDQETGRSRAERRVTGVVATCPSCGVRGEYPIRAPFVGRRVEERGSEFRGGRMHRRGGR